ncbi:translational GTPase TypA [candidate division CSSED10-310 bacterium]|uniref:50S ribosomal subunit assembly factor BipA n=1 Tax=candidate division CSSED10-310 bacterium TaxID=2855610 RepID=A0ABV6YU17_UNCC1
MDQTKIRNIAIIAHVDHGKTTLVDRLFEQSGMFQKHEAQTSLLMDSMDIERERGITISSKNGSFCYQDYWINIIDTPGHADFSGQVERVLRMADGALLLVDAQEGPMPQTYFVLKKALDLRLPIVVVINKIDKPAARPDWAVDQVFDLFVQLQASDEALDFPVVFASAKQGYAQDDSHGTGTTMEPLYKKIIADIPAPVGDSQGPLQMLVSSIDYSPFLGRLGIGKITSGSLKTNQDIAVSLRDGTLQPTRISKVYCFVKNEKIPIESAGVGQIVAVAGMDEVTVGVTFTDLHQPIPLPLIEIDPPTISMNFIPNNSPFAGQDGRFLTSRHLAERLKRERLSDVAIVLEELPDRVGFKVSGRGELHLSILIERMRREGYEFQVTKPQVIMIEQNGQTLEPYEELTLDVEDNRKGIVIEKLGQRKGQMINMTLIGGMARLIYHIPTRGLFGFKSEFLTDTKGMGVMTHIFHRYGPYAGILKNRKNGVLIAKESCTTVSFALFNLQARGKLFLPPQVPVYKSQIVGEHSRSNDLVVNPAKGKKLSNMRSAGTDESIILTPPQKMNLEDCIDFINDDEVVEVTPKAIRLRKMCAWTKTQYTGTAKSFPGQ